MNVQVFLLVFLLIFALALLCALCWLHLGPRTQHMAHRVIHSLQQLLVPGCIPLFTSDGLNLYFYALTAHFGEWIEVCRRGRNVRQWQVAAGLIYGQVKKSYRRRKLTRVRGGKLVAQRYWQRTKALAAGRTIRRWTAREVLPYPLPPVSA